jgi:hypothetical protein
MPPTAVGYEDRIHRYVKVLKILRSKQMYTRQLLNIIGSWGDGYNLIVEMSSLGLIERFRAPCQNAGEPGQLRWCIYNKVSEKGLKILEVFEGLEKGWV